MTKADSRALRLKRHLRIRKQVFGTPDRPRLSVFRSLDHLYVQLIDDVSGHTILSASTLEADVKDSLAAKTKTEQAVIIGSLIGKRALERGISEVVFDRGGYKYHGRVKALAEAARNEGLIF